MVLVMNEKEIKECIQSIKKSISIDLKIVDEYWKSVDFNNQLV